MEAQRFDTFARVIARPAARRRLMFGLVMSPFAGIIATRHAEDAAARKKRKHKKRKAKKAKPNEFGCLEVGDPCKSADQCCSGICQGKKGKQRCQAHDIGTCDQTEPGFCLGDPVQAPCDNSPHCVCTKTTAGSNVCGSRSAPSDCAECKKDADCEAQGYPPGSSCVLWANGFCTGQCPSGMACMAPCGTPPPEG